MDSIHEIGIVKNVVLGRIIMNNVDGETGRDGAEAWQSYLNKFNDSFSLKCNCEFVNKNFRTLGFMKSKGETSEMFEKWQRNGIIMTIMQDYTSAVQPGVVIAVSNGSVERSKGNTMKVKKETMKPFSTFQFQS
ncbi:hypothetical protein CAPTEDRAFT_197675 [Capitella teleta]|uniref:Uncharacterized protein n=1 Tax=Capitella teleta TaxID=283909 RepID=R7VHD1_CAPTE|nr:hypothetical protein CAPTEDRAFT_197675 [Capitella teleta]|eukprot:ELU18034.1 hypothetical protein CAPTEDRAFT_197675 [Capitella teleta]